MNHASFVFDIVSDWILILHDVLYYVYTHQPWFTCCVRMGAFTKQVLQFGPFLPRPLRASFY